MVSISPIKLNNYSQNIHKNIAFKAEEQTIQEIASTTEETQLPDTTDQNPQSKFKEKKFTTEQAIWGALAATGAGILIASGANASFTRKLMRNNRVLKDSERSAQNTVNNLRREVNELTQNLTNIKREHSSIDEILANVIEGDVTPKEVREQIYEALKTKINKLELGYDPTTPPVNPVSRPDFPAGSILLPERVETNYRSHIKKLNIPEIKPDGSFDYTIPHSFEVHSVKEGSTDFEPIKGQLSNLSEKYAESLNWNNDKIARDLLQNFFDGHGQTLDGVRLHFEPVNGGRYRIKISGESTYSADKAVLMGESSKQNNKQAAGNFGEGLKVAMLKILKDKGAENVKVASANWEVNCSLMDSNFKGKRVLGFDVNKVPYQDENYIEFETTDKHLLHSLRKTIDRFYHSGNEHFKLPNFENEYLGIKKLEKGEKGGIYIAGQRIEFNNNYDGLEDYVIFFRKKPPKDVLDLSRDRVSLNSDSLGNLATWIAKESNITLLDKAKILKLLEDFWGKNNSGSAEPLDKFVEELLNGMWVNCLSGAKIQFPEKYIAYSNASDGLVKSLEDAGFKVCKDRFKYLGMRNLSSVIADLRNHCVLTPTEKELKRIAILKEAIQKLTPSLKDKHFTSQELDTRIYLFDRTSLKDFNMYKDTDAEAIIHNGTSKGFWVDKTYFNSATFSQALEDALHELSHKAGGDGSANFGYKLTNVNCEVIDHIINHPKVRAELGALEKLWNEV